MTGPTIPVVPPDCIWWDGPKNEHGYGRYTEKGIRRYAHRQAYCDANQLSLSDIEGKIILHSCDNPSCVNPEHLSLGTQTDNVKDMQSKGRNSWGTSRGEDHPNAKVSDELAESIRKEYDGTYGLQKKLADKYRLPTTTVNRIVNEKDRFNGS
jgi:hypothetical protein